MTQRLNSTTERFARQSRDRGPFTEDEEKSSWLDWAYGFLIALVVGLAIFALYYSRTTP